MINNKRKNACLRSLSLFCCLAIVASYPFSHSRADSSQASDDNARPSRLIGLCKLWGHVKYLHPTLAYRSDIDWDAELVATIPKVREAKSSSEYANALQSLLSVLDDPVTRIVSKSLLTQATNLSENRHASYRLTDDGILVLRAGDYSLLSGKESQERLKAAVGSIPKARVMVFDLRSDYETGDWEKFQLTSNLSQIERLITTNPTATPGERVRIHYGHKNSFGFQYKSGFFIQDGDWIGPAQNAKELPAVFVLNKNSGVLRTTIARQATGKAVIVVEGEPKDISNARFETLDLGEGVSAQVRVTQPILSDGTSGEIQADIAVTVPQGDRNQTIETALSLARDFRASKSVRKQLASTATPARDRSYPEMKYPAVEYRLMTAFRIWNVFNYFFPYKGLMNEDWDLVLRDFIPKFERAKDALDYSLTVAEMVTHVHDSHAYVSGSVLDEHFGTGYPPVRVRIIEDTPVITTFFDEREARSAGIEIGDVVLRVDGEDAKTRMARYGRYISASTPQSNIDKAALTFMNGPPDSVVILTIRDRTNREKQVKLTRRFQDYTTLYHRERAGEITKLMPGNIGYVDLDRLTNTSVDEMFDKLKGTKGIIFDMRGYPDGTAWSIAPRLTKRHDVPTAFFETPVVRPTAGVGEIKKTSDAFYQFIPAAASVKSLYLGRTVMLIDERTMSQAEHTGLFLRAANGTRFVGSHTAGANGEVTTFSVPGGIGIGFTGQSVRYPDGKQLQRIGLVPDIEVRPTIKGIREGRDEVLAKAIEYLTKN